MQDTFPSALAWLLMASSNPSSSSCSSSSSPDWYLCFPRLREWCALHAQGLPSAHLVQPAQGGGWQFMQTGVNTRFFGSTPRIPKLRSFADYIHPFFQDPQGRHVNKHRISASLRWMRDLAAQRAYIYIYIHLLVPSIRRPTFAIPSK